MICAISVACNQKRIHHYSLTFKRISRDLSISLGCGHRRIKHPPKLLILTRSIRSFIASFAYRCNHRNHSHDQSPYPILRRMPSCTRSVPETFCTGSNLVLPSHFGCFAVSVQICQSNLFGERIHVRGMRASTPILHVCKRNNLLYLQSRGMARRDMVKMLSKVIPSSLDAENSLKCVRTTPNQLCARRKSAHCGFKAGRRTCVSSCTR